LNPGKTREQVKKTRTETFDRKKACRFKGRQGGRGGCRQRASGEFVIRDTAEPKAAEGNDSPGPDWRKSRNGDRNDCLAALETDQQTAKPKKEGGGIGGLRRVSLGKGSFWGENAVRERDLVRSGESS